MSYLIDTDVLIELERKTPAALLAKFMGNSGQLNISSISLAELHYGVAKSSQPQLMREAIQALIAQLTVLDFDGRDAEAAGQIRDELRRQGTPIGPYDNLIAAQARARGLVVVSGNTREYERVAGLRVENWLKN